MRITYRSGAALLLAAGLVAGACGDDEEGPSSLPPPGPPEIQIVQIVASPGAVWTPNDPLPLNLDCERRIVVSVGPLTNGRLTNWTLRPPRACGGIANCGYVVASLLDGAGERLYGTEAALTALAVDLSSGTPEDVRRLRVELYDGATEMPFFNTDGGAAADEIDVELATAMDCEGLGGAGGQAGATSQGGAGQGGQGGA